MNENQARRKQQDLKNSMRDFRFEGNPNRDYNPIEEAAMHVNAARMEEERDIGKPDEHPSTIVYGD